MGLHMPLPVFLFMTLLIQLTTQQKVKYARFVGTKDAIFPSSALKKVTAQSPVSCTLQCSQTKGCRSWNFYQTRTIENCELNSHKALSNDLLVSHGGVYYQDIKEEMDCNDLYGAGVSTIKITGFGIKEVYCDNGWLVEMRRYDSTADFNRNWSQYKFGFGDPRQQFWMGNEALHAITKQGDYSLLINMLSCNGNYYYAKWNLFKVKSELMKYAVDNALTIESYNTTNTDGLLQIRGGNFGTFDNTDAYSPVSNKTCAEQNGGGWWFKSCTYFHLTGYYPDCNHTDTDDRLDTKSKMKSKAITGNNCDIGCLLQAATMKIRRNN
ncbi:fibrinogen-like protein A [Lingula anatina]|uniref:Fibrinogen-like protein A n=1 Tax=Lingula anatina TaxID=7574 RepID=A0A1S3K4Q7_LINAN|nr:fibrinogen-like protein A [Lingula anatina]|eukprot:XP_013417615.2 fibrinogen-like protein A [Lingula anatina]